MQCATIVAMEDSSLLVAAFGRIRDLVGDVVDGLTSEQLSHRVDEEANSIGWLVWHLSRIQDDHVADAAGTEQVWTASSWHQRFRLPFHPSATGFGHGPEEVAAVQGLTADLLVGYHDEVHARTADFVAALAAEDLDRIVDTAWDPPVTLGVRLVSVLSDDLQHAGQAAFIRGLIQDAPADLRPA